MAKAISGADEAWFIGANDELVGLHANKMTMALSSKPVNKRWVRLMRGILLDYLDGMLANSEIQTNFTV